MFFFSLWFRHLLQYAPNRTGPWAWPSRRFAAYAWNPARSSFSSRSCWSSKRRWRFAATFMDSIQTSCGCSSTVAFRRRLTICSWETTWIEVRALDSHSWHLINIFNLFSGKQSLETICLLLAYKIKYPENFFLLRGNHECASINRIYGNFPKAPIDWEIHLAIFRSEIGFFRLRHFTYMLFLSAGFYDECKRRYNVKLWKTFTDCFNCLPIAAIIDEKIFCCHGGLSPDLHVSSE